MKRIYIISIVAIMFAFCIYTHTALAQIPKLISYQGVLTDQSGLTFVSDGKYSITFRIYEDSTTLNDIWNETHPSVDVKLGLFNAHLGSITPLIIPFNRQYWLGIRVQGSSIGSFEFTERIQMTSSPYALNAVNVENAVISLNGQDGQMTIAAGANITVDNNGSTITISSTGSGGLEGINNTDGTLDILNPNGPTTTINLAQSGAATGQVLGWNGTKWAPTSSTSGGIQSIINTDGLLEINAQGNSMTINLDSIQASKLSNYDARQGQVLGWNGSGWTPTDCMPVGTIVAFYGQSFEIPNDWLLCNGDAFNNTLYPVLSSRLGVNATPDLRGLFLRGSNNGRNDGREDMEAGSRLGGVGVEQIGSYQEDKAKPPYSSALHIRSGSDGYNVSSLSRTTNGWDNDGLNQNFDTRPRNMAVNWIIKAR